jgi:crotonobetainyl-CoA:carnitine CoA-transferase CaiB-like acyl-CoA transferase
MSSPLEGIRVLEVANYLAAPAAAAILADMGAEVIKVEPPSGDAWRHYRLNSAGFTGDIPENWAFQTDNRGKRSICIDLESEDGRSIVRRLADRSDVFVTNLLPRRIERYGLDYSSLSSENSRLIYAFFNGYGMHGPDSDRAGFDYAAYWARSGIMGLVGEDGNVPPLQRPGMGDHTTSLVISAAVLAALFSRERTGEGQLVDLSLYNTGIWVLSADIQAALMTGQEPKKNKRTSPTNPLWNTYLTSDGMWLMLVMVQPDPYWPKVCRALGRTDLEDNARFSSFDGRAAHSTELVAIFDAIFRTSPRAEWEERLDDYGVIWAPVASVTDVINDPQADANGFFRTVEHGNYGPIRVIDTPMHFSKSEVHARGAAPEIGQHTEEVLLELGLDWDEIGELRAGGALG